MTTVSMVIEDVSTMATPLIIDPETEVEICPVCGTFAGCEGEEPDCPDA